MAPKKKLYNNKSRRDTPRRSAHAANPYASISPTLFAAKVDDLLGKETFDEKYERERRATSKGQKGSASKKKTSPEPVTLDAAQPKDDEQYETETEVEERSDDLVTDETGSPDYDDFEEIPQASRKAPPNSDRNKRRKTSANSVSSAESSKSTYGAQVSHMRDRKEAERVQAADERPQTGGSSHRKLMAYKQQIDKLTKANQDKDRNIVDLASNFDHLHEKYSAINDEHSQIKVFFNAVRQNPKLLEKQKATNLQKATTNPKKRGGDTMDSNYEEDEQR